METRNLRKTRQGVVISNKMDKTIVIAAKFKEKHYGNPSSVKDKEMEISSNR